MQSILWSDERINYTPLERWQNKTVPDGKQTAWQGGQIRFSVKNTTQLVVYASILSQSYNSALAVNIDSSDTYKYNFYPAGETHNGTYSITITLPDTGLHTIVLKTSADMPLQQLAGTAYIRITEFRIDTLGSLIKYRDNSSIKVMVIGDSWCAAWSDWPRLLPNKAYDIYPVAYGGANASEMNTKFPLLEGATTATDATDIDAVSIVLGVNDFNSAATTAAFKISLGALIDKIQLALTGVPILLVQVPKNVGAGLNFNQYGVVESELAAEKTGVRYLSTETIENSLTWTSGYPIVAADLYHLSFASRQVLANFIGAELDTMFSTGFRVLPLKVKLEGSTRYEQVEQRKIRGGTYIEIQTKGLLGEVYRSESQAYSSKKIRKKALVM